MPTTPAGFTVTVYAELQAPRMMVYAPNGDLFVSSPSAHNITVLRDANNDGVFEERGVYAQGEAPPRRGGAPAARRVPAARRAARLLHRPTPPPPPPPPTEVNPTINGPILGDKAPACAAPPAFHAPGPGTLSAPFGLAFHNGFLYVGTPSALIRYKYTAGDLQAQGPPKNSSTCQEADTRRATSCSIAPAPRCISPWDRSRTTMRVKIAAARPSSSSIRMAPAIASTRPEFAIRSASRCSQAATSSGPRSTNATTSATISYPTTRRRSKTAGSTAGRTPTSGRTTTRATLGRFRISSNARSCQTC